MPASRKPVDEALAMAGVLTAKPERGKILTIQTDNRSGVTTDERLIDIWLERYESVHTRRAYATDVDLFLDFIETLPEPARTLGEVTVAHVVAYQKHLRSKSAPATHARRMSSLKSLLSFGTDTGYLRFNVGAAIKIPHLLNHLAERILTVEQVRNLVAAARPGRDRALVKFLYFSGARVSEALKLEWRHVHDDDAMLRVTLHGKGNKTRRIPMPALMAADFEVLSKLRLGKYVFESCYGNRLDSKDAWRIVRQATEDAFISRPVSPHWLRHAHATHALERGVPLNVLKETLGHASLRTSDSYVHASPTESSGLFLSL